MAVQDVTTRELSMKEMLTELIAEGGSDLHIAVGVSPILRIANLAALFL